MEKQFKNEIKKLADIVVWADDWIEELKTGLTEEELEEDTGIEEFETVKKVVLESINRHAVYTNALNKDIADKAAKIELLEKEIEGRKKAFNDLREETANQYIAIETHNDICKTYEKDLDYYKNQERIRTSQLRATESKVDELWKEIENFTREEDDDYGRAGFKRYIEHLIEEEERAVPDRFKERLNKEITEIFTKEKETEVNGIPCGEDAIE